MWENFNDKNVGLNYFKKPNYLQTFDLELEDDEIVHEKSTVYKN